MHLLDLCCKASLLLLFMPWAGGENDAELQSLQEILEALEQLQEEEGAPALEDELGAGAEVGGSEWDLQGLESSPVGALLPAPSPPQPAGGQSQWRSLLSSFGRRHFSGCFGTRMERIGAQSGLGCNHYKARRFLEEKEKLKPGLALKHWSCPSAGQPASP
ncbi:natriuretic peptides B-like [Lagopus leucura]|uniref:natriuretic peptides B-like n=1 Tax=Lagopus leucura TaxID=30410 RepID=UPI001C686086|nr:natriuretic peptides B-like [Lagopus leucura]